MFCSRTFWGCQSRTQRGSVKRAGTGNFGLVRDTQREARARLRNRERFAGCGKNLVTGRERRLRRRDLHRPCSIDSSRCGQMASGLEHSHQTQQWEYHQQGVGKNEICFRNCHVAITEWRKSVFRAPSPLSPTGLMPDGMRSQSNRPAACARDAFRCARLRSPWCASSPAPAA